jgi:hypothetical protein
MYFQLQRSNAIVEDVTGSNFFLSESHKLKSFRKNLEPLKDNLKKLLENAKKNRHYLERLEVSYKSFLISRSAGNDSTLDLCINRDLPTAPFDTRLHKRKTSNVNFQLYVVKKNINILII